MVLVPPFSHGAVSLAPSSGIFDSEPPVVDQLCDNSDNYKITEMNPMRSCINDDYQHIMYAYRKWYMEKNLSEHVPRSLVIAAIVSTPSS